MQQAQREVLRAARRFRVARALYWRTSTSDGNTESTAQELLGAGLAYQHALLDLWEKGDMRTRASAYRRLTALRQQIQLLSQRYNAPRG